MSAPPLIALLLSANHSQSGFPESSCTSMYYVSILSGNGVYGSNEFYITAISKETT